MEIISTPNLKVIQYKTACLAQFAYLIESKGEIAVIDPKRDIAEYLDQAKKSNSEIKSILMTHYHADFVSGQIELAKETNATIVYGPDSKPEFEAKVAEENEKIKVGEFFIRVMHTPGHTFESSCYLLEDANEKPLCVFTGDTLFLGDVGRPDLAQKGDFTSKDLAALLFNSLKKLKKLPDGVIVLPGHGAGSACGKNISSGTSCIIENQKADNYAMKIENEQEFVEAVTEGIEDPPEYFGHNIALNKTKYLLGSEEIQNQVKPVNAKEAKSLLDSDPNYYILDVRKAQEFDIEHPTGAIHVPLEGQFAIWAASIFKPTDKIILLSNDQQRLDEAKLRLPRTGLDNVVGYIEGGMEAWKNEKLPISSVDNINYEDAASFMKETEGHKILDIRAKGELDNNGLVDSSNLYW